MFDPVSRTSSSNSSDDFDLAIARPARWILMQEVADALCRWRSLRGLGIFELARLAHHVWLLARHVGVPMWSSP